MLGAFSLPCAFWWTREQARDARLGAAPLLRLPSVGATHRRLFHHFRFYLAFPLVCLPPFLAIPAALRRHTHTSTNLRAHTTLPIAAAPHTATFLTWLTPSLATLAYTAPLACVTLFGLRQTVPETRIALTGFAVALNAADWTELERLSRRLLPSW